MTRPLHTQAESNQQRQEKQLEISGVRSDTSDRAKRQLRLVFETVV